MGNFEEGPDNTGETVAESPDRIKYQYDRMGQQYIEGQDAFFAEREDWARITALKYLGDLSNRKVLDIGCGGGTDFKVFEEQGAQVSGIDASEVMVEAAKQRVANPDNVRQGEYESIPFPAGEFEIIFGKYSLHYLENLGRAYQEMHRTLVPGGILLQVVSHPYTDKDRTSQDEKLVTIELYDNATQLTFPPHTLQDYFSPTFFQLFDLQAVEEKAVGKGKIGALLYYARARRL